MFLIVLRHEKMGCICCKEDATEEEREPLIQAEDISSSLSRPRSVRSRPDLDGFHTSLTGTPTDVNQNKAYEEIMKRFNDSIIPFETHGRLGRDFIEQEMSNHQMYFNEYFGNIKVDLLQNFKGNEDTVDECVPNENLITSMSAFCSEIRDSINQNGGFDQIHFQFNN